MRVAFWILINISETEHYLIVSGQGKFTVGVEEMEIQVESMPVLVTIPANVPHQTLNTGTEDLVWFYFFPETQSIGAMRYFYVGHGCIEIYGRQKESDRLELLEIENQ